MLSSQYYKNLKNLKKVIIFLILIFLYYIFISCFPGGWSGDSSAFYRNALESKVQSVKPPLVSLIMIFLIAIFKSYNFFVFYNLQIILYLFSIYKLSTLLSFKKSIFLIIFFSTFFPFMGIIMTIWTISFSIPFLIFSLYFLFLKIEKKESNDFLFYTTLLLFALMRWENVVIGGILLFLYLIKEDCFQNQFFNKKKLMIKLLLSIFITTIVFVFNIISNHYLLGKKSLISSYEKKSYRYKHSTTLLHLSGKLEEDLIPKIFLSEKFSNLNSAERIKAYKEYYKKSETYKKKDFFKRETFTSNLNDFKIYIEQLFNHHSETIYLIEKRILLKSIINKNLTVYTRPQNLNNRNFGHPNYKDFKKFSFVENINVKKKIRKYLKKATPYNHIIFYFILSIILSIGFFFKSLKIKDQVYLKYKFFSLSLISSATFILTISVTMMGALMIEFRIITLSVFCLFVSLFFIPKSKIKFINQH